MTTDEVGGRERAHGARPRVEPWRLVRGGWALVLLLALVAAPARAQSAPSGEALAPLLPATLGGAPRREVQTYTRFATAAYVLGDGTRIQLQLHEVIGEGSAAYQRSSCPRAIRLAGRDVCVRTMSSGVSLSWVLSDALQVILGGADEATLTRLSRGIDLRAIERVAPAALDTAAVDAAPSAEGSSETYVEGTGRGIEQAPPTLDAPRARVLSVPVPAMPPEARRAGIEGRVVVRVEVAADGSVPSSRVLRGDPALAPAALEAARAGRFAPARDADGRAIASSVVVVFDFRLDD